MTITRWDPMREVVGMRRALEHWLNDEWLTRATGWEGGTVPVDVVEKDGEVQVTATVPGFAPGELDITAQGDVLVIKGTRADESEGTEGSYRVRERRTGSVYRAIRLPCPVDSDGAQAEYKNGELVVTLPKRAEAMARRIAVN
jgi:HSP20 family protein